MSKKDIRVDVRLVGLLKNPGKLRPRISNLIKQAASFIVEAEYVEQVPVDRGDLKGDIKVIRVSDLTYKVTTDAEHSGALYPEILHRGSGSLEGAPDYGYTTGRVRDNDIAYGIGGIRPNKFADRTREKTHDKVVNYVRRKILL